VIEIHVTEVGGRWYALACYEKELVATAAAGAREGAVYAVSRLLPTGVEHRIAQQPVPHATETLAMLAALESGDESKRRFSLSPRYVPERLARILTTAAAIPIGYVTSYGQVARTANNEARAVGRVMASNPLYPIVPCHRVLGTDFSLVGYGGRRSPSALEAKLNRLRAEQRGRESERDVEIDGASLRVYPVERVIERADRERQEASRQRRLFDEPGDV
jgi:methylated-DNA-[protein]-cysteine S-methyltransferase